MGNWWLFILLFILLLIASMVTVGGIKIRRRILHRQRNGGKSPKPRDTLVKELVHEIRNPLNSISLNLQLLAEDLSGIQGEEREDLQKRVRRIGGEVERLDQVLTDFGRYAKLPPLKLETCDLAMLIEEVLHFSEPELQRQNIEIIREIEPLPPIQLDHKQFKQALWNLIINAYQAMADGGQLTVRASVLAAQVKIDVGDTGEGIHPDAIDKIFDLFVSTKEEGSGVGLAIVKQVIEGHGGSVEVESTPNQGATFSILLPIKIQSTTPP
jgi:signal transduction histidine kinase